jgi:hypothetical protein
MLITQLIKDWIGFKNEVILSITFLFGGFLFLPQPFMEHQMLLYAKRELYKKIGCQILIVFHLLHMTFQNLGFSYPTSRTALAKKIWQVPNYLVLTRKTILIFSTITSESA